MQHNKKLVTPLHLYEKAEEVLDNFFAKAFPEIKPEVRRIMSIAVVCSLKVEGIHLSLIPPKAEVCEVSQGSYTVVKEQVKPL